MTVGRRIPHERKRFLFDAVFSQSAGRGGSVVFFVRVLCCLKKLRETAIEQESLQATPHLYERCSFNTSNFNQASMVIIFKFIVNVTRTPVSTQSSGNMGKKLSQNREIGKSCSGYSQDTSTQFTIVIDNGKISRGRPN